MAPEDVEVEAEVVWSGGMNPDDYDALLKLLFGPDLSTAEPRAGTQSRGPQHEGDD